MADRPFPPSPRRIGLARRAGLHAASPLLAGALACGALTIAAIALAGSARARLGAWLEAACAGTDRALLAGDAPAAVLEVALPLLAASALAAAIAHLAQTRALWLPRRRVPGAPALARGPIERVRAAGFELAAAAIIGGCAIGWLYAIAPRLAALPQLPLAGAALIASALATLACAWAALGILDSLARHAELARALRMSAHDKREDDRLSAADPRWRAYRARTARTTPAEAVAAATVLVLGDGTAVAISWDPARRPIPTRTAVGRAARATQLLGLARRHRIPVHRDPALASALVASDGLVPDRHWPRLAEVIAAVRGAR